jgi:hypothetical protein
MTLQAKRSSYPTDEASYLRLANRWKELHDSKDEYFLYKALIGLVAFVVLLPVIGMVLVFAVLPALPLALLVGAVLGPTNLIPNGEEEDEDEVYNAKLVFAEAHAHGH